MSPREAGVFLGISHVTVTRWIKAGKVKATQKPGKNNKKPSYHIDPEEVARLKLEISGDKIERTKAREKKEQSREKTLNRKLELPEVEKEPEREIKSGGGLTRLEAERYIKQEEAIRKQRENLEREGLLVESSDIRKVLELHYRALIDGMEELIDGWAISFNLDTRQSQKMLTEWKLKLDTTWSKVKRGLRQT